MSRSEMQQKRGLAPHAQKRYGLLAVLALSGLLILSLVLTLASCNGSTAPGDSPISPLAADYTATATLPPVLRPGEQAGYLRISWPDYWPNITGTMHITHELRTLNDAVLAFHVDKQPITMTSLLPITTTIGPQIHFGFAWPIALNEPAIDWIKGALIVEDPTHATIQVHFFSDIETYNTPDERGFWPIRLIQIQQQFLPLILQDMR